MKWDKTNTGTLSSNGVAFNTVHGNLQDFLTSRNPLTTYKCEFISFAIDQLEVHVDQIRDFLEELISFLQNTLTVLDQVSRVSYKLV